MFVDDWRNWKSILRRFAGIAFFNILLLFVMGPGIFMDFLQSVTTQLDTPGWTWNGNHSISAFVYNLTKDGFGIISAPTLEALQAGHPRRVLLPVAARTGAANRDLIPHCQLAAEEPGQGDLLPGRRALHLEHDS